MVKLVNRYEQLAAKGALADKPKRARSGSQRRKERGRRGTQARGRRGGMAE